MWRIASPTLRVTLVLLTFIDIGSLAKAGNKVAVSTGGDANFDACGAVGRVVGLNGKSMLQVRSGPGTNFAIIDRLTASSRVILCDKKGSWIGVVYPHDSEDCETSSPQVERKPYEGPCKSGWMYEKYIELEAG